MEIVSITLTAHELSVIVASTYLQYQVEEKQFAKPDYVINNLRTIKSIHKKLSKYVNDNGRQFLLVIEDEK